MTETRHLEVDLVASDSLGSIAVSWEWDMPPGAALVCPAEGPQPKLTIHVDDMNEVNLLSVGTRLIAAKALLRSVSENPLYPIPPALQDQIAAFLADSDGP